MCLVPTTLSAATPSIRSGGKKRNPAQRRRSGWFSGTSTITILNPSGSRICISLNLHGLSVGSSIISTLASSSSCPAASTSRTCNHRPTLSLAPAREEPDSSRKPPRIACVQARYSRRRIPMIYQDSVLVQLIRLVDQIPTPQPPPRCPRGRPIFYSEKLFSEGPCDHDRQTLAQGGR